VRVTYLDDPWKDLTPLFTGSVVAIGVFDGLHSGHMTVLERARELARVHQCPCCVFTFVEHPRTVLYPENPVPLLTPWPEKQALLEAQGVDACVAAHFTEALARMSPEEFVQRVLVDWLQVRAVVTGFNFRFGRDQAGVPAKLVALGEQAGFDVVIVEPQQAFDGDTEWLLSSSHLRNLLREGQVEMAAHLVKRPYALTGEVVHGDKRGRQIGFPTANLLIDPQKLLPANGVYACWVCWAGQRRPGIVNIGVRPTFGSPRLVIEAHVFDWSGDLYGATLTLELVSRIRAERAFPGIAELVEQITQDCDIARASLGTCRVV
jgi:riboflavin kinase/FMN adenylyltransferase